MEENKKPTEQQEVDNRTFGEKAEDKMDEIVGGVQDIIYGPGDDFNNDIPATIEKPSGIRKVNKVQTRRNFNKRVFGKRGLKILLIILGLGIGMFLIYNVLAGILMM